MKRILIIEDDPVTAAVYRQMFERRGYRAEAAVDGLAGLETLAILKPDGVLLDVMLPGIDGLEVCRRVRAAPEWAALPVLMLTARGEDVDKIVGLELGADDYLAKPFNPRELLARLRAVLRRGAADAPRTRFTAGRLTVDFDAREVELDGRRVVLTHHEFELLAALARAGGRVLSREQLMDALKGQEYEAFDRSIDVHVSKLRAKLEKDPRAPRYIKTVRGVGYALVRPGPAR